MAPRSRSAANAWLQDYPGLHVFPDGRYYVIHPTTKRKASLDTRAPKVAIALYNQLRVLWDEEGAHTKSQVLLKKLMGLGASTPVSSRVPFKEFAKEWRELHLGFLVDADGAITRAPCKVMKRDGKPVEPRTRDGYGRHSLQLENAEGADFLLSDGDLVRRTRQLLAPWADKPSHYNHLLAVASHIYRLAIIKGMIDANPTRDIDKLPTKRRQVYIPDDAYVAITDKLCTHNFDGEEWDGEWRARICDLLYMVSSRPMDIFLITDKQLWLPVVDLSKPSELRVYGEIRFMHEKNDEDQIITMNEDMREAVDWFIAFKRRHRIVCKSLLCYPPYMRRWGGHPVTHSKMRDYWNEAVEEAGYAPSQYWLSDLRKKGLSDEYVNQGENDKGGHRTQAAKEIYRLSRPPKRARNTLVNLRKASG